ncbi:MAG TPA: large conductance mechanosensitive channel protein MscL [Nocardioidaceae bacterium]|jgi:large conductance mechanosensitive channel|nr:large conductance mechanosensitive channel protein MscL [Nocardioidaceae bacterium]
MLKGFKDFIMRGNLVELAVAFIIATAFAAVVTAFVGFIMSIISKVAGGPPNLDDMHPGGILIGPVLTALISFLIIAAVVYFLVVVPYNKLQERRARGQEEAPTPPAEDVALLTEIRDLLANGSRPTSGI